MDTVIVYVKPDATDASVWASGHNIATEVYRIDRPAGFQQFLGR